MTILTTYVLTPSELLDNDLLGPELVENFAGHASAIHSWMPDRRGPVLSTDQQNFRKDEFVTKLAVAAVDTDPVTLTNAELMTAFFDNRIHTFENSLSELRPSC